MTWHMGTKINFKNWRNHNENFIKKTEGTPNFKTEIPDVQLNNGDKQIKIVTKFRYLMEMIFSLERKQKSTTRKQHDSTKTSVMNYLGSLNKKVSLNKHLILIPIQLY